MEAKKFQSPYFAAVDLKPVTVKDHFRATVTDRGLCHALGGTTIEQTYTPNRRNVALRKALDNRKSVVASKIYGTGAKYSKTFWLNVEDNSIR